MLWFLKIVFLIIGGWMTLLGSISIGESNFFFPAFYQKLAPLALIRGLTEIGIGVTLGLTALTPMEGIQEFIREALDSLKEPLIASRLSQSAKTFHRIH